MRATAESIWSYCQQQSPSELSLAVEGNGLISGASLGHYGKDLVAAWDARDDDHKFMVVGIAHHAENPTYEEAFAPLARRGALRLLPISDQCIFSSYLR